MTPERIARLYRKGFSLLDIVGVSGLTRYAVRRALAAQGVQLRPRIGGLPEAAHGTRSRYTAGCHCDPCTEANTIYEFDRRTR